MTQTRFYYLFFGALLCSLLAFTPLSWSAEETYSYHKVDGVVVVDTTLIAAAEQTASGVGQTLTSKWFDDSGMEHIVETNYSGTDMDLAVSRHNKLVIAMKQVYPPRQP